MSILCFDVGGTYIKYGVINHRGEMFFHDKFPTPKMNCHKSIPAVISEYAKKIMATKEISCIGISTAGQVDSLKGIITHANENLPDYTGCELSAAVECATGLKVYVENDAHCAALGETHFGAGKHGQSFFCLTLGTGVGGAIILGRKLYKGANHSAGAIGYLTTQDNTCVDKSISTRGLLKTYSEMTGQTITGVELFNLIKLKNHDALSVYQLFLSNLVDTMLNISYLLDPELIILGGAISSQGEHFFNDINQCFQQKCLAIHRTTTVVKAQLENTAGLMGACYIASHRDYSFN